MGSKWFFYPFHFVIKRKRTNGFLNASLDKQKVLEVPYCLEFLKNKPVKTVQQYFRDNEEYIMDLMRL